jgi:hypothetical protein
MFQVVHFSILLFEKILLENNHNCRKVGISVVVKAGSRRHHDKGNNIGVENFGSRQFLCLRSLKKPN